MNKNTAPFMRQAVMDLEESRIREVANAGMGRPDVLAFWFGESDEVTPDIVRQAAIDSMQKGETFYSHNLGLPELRQAVSDYMSALHGPVGVDRLAITSGGVNALMLAAQSLIDAGDEVVAVTPVWPNLTAQALVSAPLGAPELLPELVETIRTGLQMGLEAKPLFAQRWEEGWSRPLQEWREELQLRPFAERVGRL
jgi:aspartate/methionine/tyrosine aminotransferase